ncbi:Brefeldin A-inhibited guanine nucleotide-exchange protein 1 [Gaertneriomyces sp. JEL0708]|nr:Brefeldin A-inhibited guanine nucleotide-exchange protein 1 [Gaertneriomyces sp. JEL0708]
MPDATMTAGLLQSSLERLQAECGRNKELREAVEDALQNLALQKESGTDGSESLSADRYWTPFKIACQPSQPTKTREIALDCLQKLIAHNLLRGAVPIIHVKDSGTNAGRSATTPGLELTQLDASTPEADGGNGVEAASTLSTPPVFTERSSSLLVPDAPHYPPKPFLIDEIIHTVCTTFLGGQTDEAVQLQVLKVLLTAVTSTTCEIHDVSLLKVVQTCFNIYLYSKVQVNQMTAKASLTQMINLIFSRMERYSQVLARSRETGSTAEIEKLIGIRTGLSSTPETIVQTTSGSKSAAESAANDSIGSSQEGDTGTEAIPQTDSKSLTSDTPASATSVNDVTSPGDDTLATDDLAEHAMQIEETSDTDLETARAVLPTIVPNGSNELEADGTDSHELAQKGDEEVTEPANSTEDTLANDELSTCQAPQSPEEPATIEVNNPYNPTIAHYNELLRKDVFIVFRLLCRASVTSDNPHGPSSTSSVASMKEVAALPMGELSAQAVKARQLALELILSIMNNCGSVFQTDELYMGLIRQSLCVSISRNSVTTNPVLFELSLSIFLMVMRYYRSRLKPEMEVLLNTIYLHIVEMGNSTYSQKRMVLQGLLKICENPQTLADLYVNYDCDIAMVSLFERIVTVCSRVSQGRENSSANMAGGLVGFAVSAAGLDTREQMVKTQEKRLKLMGLCCLAALVQSLVEWSVDVAPWLPVEKRKIRGSFDTRKSSTYGAGDMIPRTSLGEEKPSASSPSDSNTTEPAPENPAAKFLDALSATKQAHPVLVNKNPLRAVSMEHTPYGLPRRSASVDSFDAVTPEEDSYAIENMASRKELLRECIRQFNLKPKKGVSALVQHGFIEDDVMSIAQFLRNTESLTKAAIGEYLGEGDAFNVDVMHAFIDMLDFTGMGFVAALRAFLQTFRLPGEAQKIDRIMEKFADRYFETNPDVFAKADAAYTLAFSVIMLNTDQHSPQIKHPMDKAAFVKNNQGINDDGDLPQEYLEAIFDEVAANEIIMEEEHVGKLAQMAIGWGAGDLNDRQRMELYRREIQHVQQKSQQLIQNAQRAVAPFRTAMSPELARPMFGRASWPLMAVFSLAFEAVPEEEDVDGFTISSSTDPRPVDLCLEGFSGSIRLASIFRMETERDAFVTSLSKLTGLSHIHDIKPKNVRAIKTLIKIANALGEYLESSWMQVLKAISQLERLQLIANHASFGRPARTSTDSDFRNSEDNNQDFYNDKSLPSRGGYRTIEDLTSNSKPNAAVGKLIAEFHSQETVVAVDRIFTNTLNLSATAIIHFFRCLCHVSMEEVGLDPSTPSGHIPRILSTAMPRMYLLQKIVEIAYYNMPRIRFEWTQIWRILQPYFNTVACHPNPMVSTFAVDSLRQLSMKFLEREELGHYSAQNEFLRSFEWIMKHNTNPNIRELILSSMSQMITARARSIRSGWRSIFVVLAKAAQTSTGDGKLVKMAFGIVQNVFKEHFDAVMNAGAFVDYISCLAEFALLDANFAPDDVVMGSIQLLQACASYLVKRGVENFDNKPRRLSQGEVEAIKSVTPTLQVNGLPPVPAPTLRVSSQPYLLPDGTVSEDHFFLKWFPILSAFSRVIIDSDSSLVRTRAMDTLFDTLKISGHMFSVDYWKKIQRGVIFPIFADLSERTDSDSQEPRRARGKETDTAIWVHGLRLLVDLTTSLFVRLASESRGDSLKGLLELLTGMLQRRDEKLATTGGIFLHGFVKDNLGKFGKCGAWDLITEQLEKAFAITLPVELLCCDYGKGLKPIPSDDSDTGKQALVAGYDAARASGITVTLDTLDFEHTLIKCVTHLELVQAMRDIAFTKLVGTGRRGSDASLYIEGDTSAAAVNNQTSQSQLLDPERSILFAVNIIPPSNRRRWLRCLYNSYAVARAFNEENELRYAIFRRGLVPQLPHLVKQETVSFGTYLKVLFAIYRIPSEQRNDDESVGDLVRETLDFFRRYAGFLKEPQRNELHIGLWSPVVVQVLNELLTVEELWISLPVTAPADALATRSQLIQHIPEYYQLVVGMLSVDRPEVRTAIGEFLRRIGDLYLKVD